MKHTIQQDSWHYRFIQRFNSFNPNSGFAPKDICEYRGRFIKALVNCGIAYLAVTSFIVLPLVMTGAWFAAAINTGIWDWSTFPSMLAGYWSIMLGGTILIGIAVVADFLRSRSEKQQRLAEEQGIEVRPSTAKLMYQSFKEKFCVPVEFK